MLCTYSVKIVLVAFLSFFFSSFPPYFITAGGLPGIMLLLCMTVVAGEEGEGQWNMAEG
jgi:hypothetical protein